MSGPMLELGAVISCPHGGQVSPVSFGNRVRVEGMPALVAGDAYSVSGCPFAVPTPYGAKPQPCTEVLWSASAARVLVHGSPVLTATSAGQCRSADGVSQGPPVPSGVQQRVVAQ